MYFNSADRKITLIYSYRQLCRYEVSTTYNNHALVLYSNFIFVAIIRNENYSSVEIIVNSQVLSYVNY